MKNKTNLTLFSILMCACLVVGACDRPVSSKDKADKEKVETYEDIKSLIRVTDGRDYYVKKSKSSKEEFDAAMKQLQQSDSVGRAKRMHDSQLNKGIER